MTGYFGGSTGHMAIFRADSTRDRRSRASQAAAAVRAYRNLTGLQLRLDHVNYDEAPGFLARSEFWYEITSPRLGPSLRAVLGDDYYGYRMPVPAVYRNYFLASEDDKWKVLESIGIPRRDGVSPLAAWRDAVADESGLDRAELDPAQGGVFDAGFTPAYVRTFMFFLA